MPRIVLLILLGILVLLSGPTQAHNSGPIPVLQGTNPVNSKLKTQNLARSAAEGSKFVNTRANTDKTAYAQQEPSIAVNPTNPLNVIASAKDERRAPVPNTNTKEVWEYASTDGGQTWANVRAPVLGFHATHQSDPVNIFRDDGTAYACYLGYGAGSFSDTGIYVSRSTDGGFTWGQTAVAVSEESGLATDKQWLAVDNNPASPFYHRLYLSWTEYGGCNGCIHFVYSTDGGATWSGPQMRLSEADNQQFSMPTVLWNGDLIITWADENFYPNDRLRYRRSTDGGRTFGAEATAGTMNASLDIPGAQWRINAIPVASADRRTPADLVIAWNDGRDAAANGLDIYMVRSTDGGTTWTAPARLNDDPPGVVIQQAEPWVAAAPDGTFHAIWYDEREDTTTATVFHIYYTRSTDGGATWIPAVRASDGATDLNIGIPQGPGWNQAAGDYIGLAATDTHVYGAWTDTRSGTNEDIYVFHTTLAGGTPTASVTGTPATPTRPAPPTHTPTRTPTMHATATHTATPSGVNLVPARLELLPVGGHRPSLEHPVQFAVTIRNAGIAPLPAATRIGFDIYTNLDHTPGPADVPALTGTLALPADLLPDQEIRALSAPISLTVAGIISPIVWLNRDRAIPETYYDDNILGPTYACLSPTDGQSFVDVPPGTYYYLPVEVLACRRGIAGYDNGDGTFSFRPFNPTTRAQMMKIVVNGFGLPPYTPPGDGQTFADVLPGSAFFTFVEAAAHAGIISGYACGGPGEACDGQERPYFRPAANVTRGQLAKIITRAGCWPLQTPAQATFADVPVGSAFYPYVETAYAQGVLSGYLVNSGREFRPGQEAVRAQVAKIVYLALLSGSRCP